MQFGDFFSDMVVNVVLDQTSATAGVVPNFPAYIGSTDQSTTSTARISSLQNTTSGVYTQYTMEYVDIAGNVLATGAAASNYVRYCEYPGQRLFKQTRFEVNGNPLDNYPAEAMVFYQKTKVGPHKLTGWKRLVGQEVPVEGVSDLLSVAGASNYPSNVAGLTDVNGSAVSSAPVLQSNTARRVHQVLDGPQTPKATQPVLEMWIPLTSIL